MNRLQKKCLVASLSFHGVLLLVLLVGPAFVKSRSQPAEMDLPLLTVIPDRIVDGAIARPEVQPVPTAPTPKRTPERKKPDPPQPEPTPQTREVRQPKPVPEPPKQKPETVVAPVKEPTYTKAADIKVNTGITTRSPKKVTVKPPVTVNPSDSTVKLASRVDQALGRLDQMSKDSVSIPVATSAAASYRQYVQSVYAKAWKEPSEVEDDRASVEVSIVISRTGKVLSSRITRGSKIPAMDRTVRAALDQVAREGLHPFPPGSRDDQEVFPITFDLKSRRI